MGMIKALGGLKKRALRETSEEFGFDQFPRTFPEFELKVERLVTKHLGKDWKQFVAQKSSNKITVSDVDRMIRFLFDGFWTLYESVGELMALYDFVQDSGGVDGGYEHVLSPERRVVLVWKNNNDYHHVTRDHRPLNKDDPQLG